MDKRGAGAKACWGIVSLAEGLEGELGCVGKGHPRKKKWKHLAGPGSSRLHLPKIFELRVIAWDTFQHSIPCSDWCGREGKG